MRKPSNIKGFAQDALIILGLVIVLTYMFRFWPLTILAIIAFLVVVVVRIFKKEPQENVKQEQSQERQSKLITDKDLFEYVEPSLVSLKELWLFMSLTSILIYTYVQFKTSPL